MNINEESMKKHYELGGKIEVISRAPLRDRHDLSVLYTPGVAAPCLEIQKDAKHTPSKKVTHPLKFYTPSVKRYIPPFKFYTPLKKDNKISFQDRPRINTKMNSVYSPVHKHSPPRFIPEGCAAVMLF